MQGLVWLCHALTLLFLVPEQVLGVRHRLSPRPSDSENNTKAEGIWQVLDPNAPRHKHKDQASCILAQFRVNIVIPVQHPNGQVSNKTIVVPELAAVSGSCGAKQQRITLMWNNTASSGKLVKTGHLTFLFGKKTSESPIYLSGVWASIDLFLEDGAQNLMNDGIPSQNLLLAAPDLDIWETPSHFAYVCHHRSQIQLQATTLPTQLSSDSDNLVMVDPVYQNEAFLVFHDLSVEVFRDNRFSKHFTHLKYDCRDKWNYDYMPYLVGACLTLLVVFDITIFAFRKRLGCDSMLSDDEFDEDDDDAADDEDEDLDDDSEPVVKSFTDSMEDTTSRSTFGDDSQG